MEHIDIIKALVPLAEQYLSVMPNGCGDEKETMEAIRNGQAAISASNRAGAPMDYLKEVERILATPDGQDELTDGDVCQILSTLLHRRALATASAHGHPGDISKGDAHRLYAVSDRLNTLATILSM